MFDLSGFIKQHVTKRSQSMFLEDIEKNREELSHKIDNITVLVIGGAFFAKRRIDI